MERAAGEEGEQMSSALRLEGRGEARIGAFAPRGPVITGPVARGGLLAYPIREPLWKHNRSRNRDSGSDGGQSKSRL
jgi:hypothetical protein